MNVSSAERTRTTHTSAKNAVKATRYLPAFLPSSLLPTVKTVASAAKVRPSFAQTDPVKIESRPLNFAGSLNSPAEKPHLANFAAAKS